VATNSRLNTAHTQQHERSTESPAAHISSSAAASGRPRGQRAIVDSASTSGDGTGLEDDGVLEGLVASNAGVPHVGH